LLVNAIFPFVFDHASSLTAFSRLFVTSFLTSSLFFAKFPESFSYVKNISYLCTRNIGNQAPKEGLDARESGGSPEQFLLL